MESFETSATPKQLMAKLEVIGKHATTALYNAGEYRRIPFRFLWMPFAKLQDGLGGKTKAILSLIGIGLGVLIAAMIFVPYPLKMEGKGPLLPIGRAFIYAPEAGQIREIKAGLKSGSVVGLNEDLLTLFSPELEKNIKDIEQDIAQATMAYSQPDNPNDVDSKKQKEEARIKLTAKVEELNRLREHQ